MKKNHPTPETKPKKKMTKEKYNNYTITMNNNK